MSELPEIKIRKAEFRALAQRRLADQSDRDVLSRRIAGRIIALPEFAAARVVLLYVSFASEVGTSTLIDEAFARGKTVGVPYCVGDTLGLFRLEDIRDLSPGAYDILGPRPGRGVPAARGRRAVVLELIVVPGVAFDVDCRRLGHGKGYYDRLLVQVRPETHLVAPAFQCQVFDEIPVAEYDVPVHQVVTEEKVYSRSRKSESS